MSTNDSTHATPHNYSALEEQWCKEQNKLKSKLVIPEDDDRDVVLDNIKYVGGCDISFFKGNNIDAVASLVVVDFSTLQVVYESYRMVQLTQPYIPGFLAFR